LTAWFEASAFWDFKVVKTLWSCVQLTINGTVLASYAKITTRNSDDTYTKPDIS